MRRFFLVSAVCLVSTVLLWAAIAVGEGAATPAIQQSFINAYDRGRFSLEVTTALTQVQPLGTPGLVQEFAVANTTLRAALIKPDPNAVVSVNDTLQALTDIYTFFTSLGVNTVGYPTNDTTVCPTNSYGTCDYQLFTKDYALFVYSSPTAANISVADPFYTEWNNLGGIGGSFGVVVGSQTAVTSPISKVAGIEQLFNTGAIFSYPASSATPTVHGIVEPAFDAFNSYGYTGLGFPTSEAFQVNSSGLMRQTFENGRIEWTAGNTPNVLFPVGRVDITYAGQGLSFAAPGATATVNATTLDTNGASVTGRTLTWSSTNGSVATVAGNASNNGYSATVTATGGGAANIYVTAEGKTSAPLVVTVGVVCCAIGQGAPTQAISLAFQAAVARNRLPVALPVPSPVTRAGTGYIQNLTASDGSGNTWTVAEADGATSAYILTGSIYSAYLAAGGFTGSLGYPVSDPLPGPVQQFAGGAALAGSPAAIVAAPVAAKWFSLGGLGSGAGAPSGPAVSFTTYSGVTGVSQGFVNGEILGVTSGKVSGQNLAGQAFFSTGPILARYLALAGPGGALGVPISDVYNNGGGVLLENFEGGYVDLQPGAAAAVEHYNPRIPALTTSPSMVAPGERVHVSATGFPPNTPLAFSITGQPGFSVSSTSGSFQWDIVVPASAKPATVLIQAVVSGATASASYTIAQVAALLPTLTLVSGDRQTGAPGSTVASPIVALLRDSAGNPLPGIPVVTSASPGGTAQTAGVTDQNGRAVVLFRLPPAAGVAVGSVSAGGQTVEFSALAAAISVQNFPHFVEATPQPLTAALGALLAWYQSNGTLPSPNGAVTAASLAGFLTSSNGFVSSETGDLIANPWIAGQFAGASLSVETPTLDHVRDLLNLGQPVILNLNLTINGGSAGGSSVDAIGINADGSIAIVDPNPALARTSLADYLNGFVAQGNSVTGALASVLSVAPNQSPAAARPFTVASTLSGGVTAGAPAGVCTGVGLMGPSGGGASIRYCDGAQSLYEADFATATGALLADLSGGPSASIPAGGGGSWAITRTGGQLTVAPLSPSITAVADSAGFGPAVSPGALFTIFGSGLSGSPTVSVAGHNAQVLAAFPFQINAVMPTGLANGAAPLQVSGPAGAAGASVTISPTSPGIFLVGAQGAILNSDGTLNGPSSPAQRGQFVSVYCTGLGATTLKGGLQTVNAPTSIVINGVTVTPSFAGLVAGFVGLYQINVTIPAGLPPSLVGSVAIQQGTGTAGQLSNTAPIAVD